MVSLIFFGAALKMLQGTKIVIFGTLKVELKTSAF